MTIDHYQNRICITDVNQFEQDVRKLASKIKANFVKYPKQCLLQQFTATPEMGHMSGVPTPCFHRVPQPPILDGAISVEEFFKGTLAFYLLL